MAETITIPGINTAEILSNVTSNLPPDIASGIDLLITIFQALGIIVIIYLIFLIISIIFNLKRYKLIKKTWCKVQEIDEKLDQVLHKKNEKKEKK